MNKIKYFLSDYRFYRFFIYEAVFCVVFVRDVFVDFLYTIKETWADYRHNVSLLKRKDLEKL